MKNNNKIDYTKPLTLNREQLKLYYQLEITNAYNSKKLTRVLNELQNDERLSNTKKHGLVQFGENRLRMMVREAVEYADSEGLIPFRVSHLRQNSESTHLNPKDSQFDDQ